MIVFFFFKQKTAYEMRISDWSSDVCSSDLAEGNDREVERGGVVDAVEIEEQRRGDADVEQQRAEQEAEGQRVGHHLAVAQDERAVEQQGGQREGDAPRRLQGFRLPEDRTSVV